MEIKVYICGDCVVDKIEYVKIEKSVDAIDALIEKYEKEYENAFVSYNHEELFINERQQTKR